MPLRAVAKKVRSLARRLVAASHSKNEVDLPTVGAKEIEIQAEEPEFKLDLVQIETLVSSGNLGSVEALLAKIDRQSTPDLYREATTCFIKALFDNGYREQSERASVGLPFKILELVSVEEWASQRGHLVLDLGESEQIPVACPPILDATGLKPAETPAKTVLSTKPYVAELRNVVISSKSSIVVTDDGYALYDVAAHPAYGGFVTLHNDKTVISQRPHQVLVSTAYPTINIEKGIYLSGTFTEHFGHWVPEFLTKLMLYEQHPAFKGMPIIVDARMPQSHFDYLSTLTDNSILRLPEDTSFRCERLLVAPTVTFYPPDFFANHTVPRHEIGPLSPAAFKWLQQTALARVGHSHSPTDSYGKKLYLSRRNMSWRKAKNDEEIANLLVEKGFRIVDVEKLSFQDQVAMFRNAECIVAPNGSSMLNLIFSPKDIKLFVLTQSEVYNWGGYYGPIHALGYDMLFLAGEELQAQHTNKHADYYMPLERIEEALLIDA